MTPISLTSVAGVKASQTLTTTGNAVAAETITIGSQVYTWVSALTGAPFQVLVGASASASLDNLKLAINDVGNAGEATFYSVGTTPHPDVEATTKTATTLLLVARAAGAAGNAIATTETMTNASFGAATLTGGVTEADAQTLTAAGAFPVTAGLDISGKDAASDYMLEIEVVELKAASGLPKALIAIEDTVDAFANRRPLMLVHVSGPVSPASSQRFIVKNDRASVHRLGTASAKMRAYLHTLEGTTPSVTIRAALHN